MLLFLVFTSIYLKQNRVVKSGQVLKDGYDENQLVLMSRGWKYPEYSHGRDGERGRSCFSERAGAWVDPPWRALLGSSVQFSCSVVSDTL